ncbi:hypothetical protein NQ176_g5135 [Zarea fungicola]|uniref:Uncharacterized protein n=1 Tax=Zarea fungicola TaxID=93591 RepID=A0ACC1NBF5_9HYPO|nr:hypothetical protein NQ176_g5135 [Lecanicillium fungicola]
MEHDSKKEGSNSPDTDIENSVQRKEPERSHRTLSGPRWAFVCASLYVSCFIYGLDTTIAADVQGPVIEAFGHVEQLTWLGTGFSLGSVSVLLLNGNLFAKFNNKWIYLVSMLVFEMRVLCIASGEYMPKDGGKLNFHRCLAALREMAAARAARA